MERASTPSLYPTRVTHLHRSPVRHYAEHRSYSWYVDIDALPHLPWWLRPFARFDPRDHFDGAPSDTLRQRVDTFLAHNDVFLNGGAVTALLMPRVVGRAFNPMSLFWCHDPSGMLRCVVAEVQNTRGERDAYLLPPAEDGPVTVREALRTSPFTVDGGYFLVRAPRPADDLDLTISLHRDNQAALVATWRGTRLPATVGQILRLNLTNPLAPQAAKLGMQFQALTLGLLGIRGAVAPAVVRPERNRSVQSSPGRSGSSNSWVPS